MFLENYNEKSESQRFIPELLKILIHSKILTRKATRMIVSFLANGYSTGNDHKTYELEKLLNDDEKQSMKPEN